MQKTAFIRRKPLVFRQFIRKGYALFAALGREVLIGTLSVTTLTYAKADGAGIRPVTNDSATQQSAKVVQLEEVSVTGSRAPLTSNQSARQVTVLTRDDIQRVAAASVNDLLKITTGVDVRQRGGFGVQTDISINGGTFDQMTILLNGVNISNPQTGHNAADFPVSLHDIERIEILEGAAARIYGSSAFSGAVNIVTRSDAQSNIRLSADGGSFGSFGSDAAVTLTSQHLRNQLSTGYLQSDGGTQNSDFRKRRIFYQGQYRSGLWSLAWQGGISSQDYGANTFYSAAYNNQYEATRHYLASADAKYYGRVMAFSATAYWNRSTDHYQLIRGASGAANGENEHLLDVYGATLNAHCNWILGKTSVGADIRKEHIWSTAYGNLLAEQEWRHIHHSERMYDHEGQRTNSSIFAEHNIVLRQITISAGLLLNQNTMLDHHWRLYPGIDVAWRPSKHWKWFASWNKALRVPTYTDLYSNNRAVRGDINLKPERNSTFKAGAQFQQKSLTANSQLFYCRGRNMIDWVYETTNDTQYHALNIGKLNNMGASFDVAWQWKNINCKAGYAYIHQHHSTAQPIYKSLYALEYLKHKITSQVTHPIVAKLNATWTARWQQRMNGYHPYWKIDGKVQWNEKKWQAYVSGDNLTAHRYYDIAGVIQPRLWLMMGGNIYIGKR